MAHLNYIVPLPRWASEVLPEILSAVKSHRDWLVHLFGVSEVSLETPISGDLHSLPGFTWAFRSMDFEGSSSKFTR